MPGRIRTIKPEFPHSESVGRLSRESRLLFILLWTIVDDAGRTRAASRLLASLLYPFDDDAPSLIDGWLSELQQNGSVRLYVIGGSQYLDIPGWREHQKIDRPTKSRLPEFVEASRAFSEPSMTDHRSMTLDHGPWTVDRGPILATAGKLPPSHVGAHARGLPDGRSDGVSQFGEDVS